MKVIGVGFGRTGTASLSRALLLLGFGPCYHMFEVVGRPNRVAQWRRAADGEPVDWDEVFEGFGSTVDWPAAAFWRELAAHYPEAKLVLTVRPPDQWFDSAAKTIFKQQSIKAKSPAARIGVRALEGISRDLREFTEMTDAAIMRRVFDNRVLEREYAIERYRRHIDEVRAEIPEHRLLEYRVQDGWKPLCDFLDAPVPGEEFPRGNDADSFARDERRWIARMVLRPVIELLPMKRAER